MVSYYPHHFQLNLNFKHLGNYSQIAAYMGLEPMFYLKRTN